MALAWQCVDTRDADPFEARYEGDPGDLAEFIDAASFVASILHRPSWQAMAACRGEGPARWFPGRGQPVDEARTICADCAVKNECLAAALEVSTNDDYGCWAGTSVRARRQLRRTIEVVDDPRCVDCGAPCTKTRCLGCHNAQALAQMPPSAA